MRPELEELCARYIAARDAVGKAFRWDDSALYAVCANIFCAAGQAADPDRLKECLKVIKSAAGPFSVFRSRKVRSILASMLALGESPEKRMALAQDRYRMLRRMFRGTEYLVLAAFLLDDLADTALTEETGARGKALCRRMNQKHRLLTDKTDSVFAALMALSDKTDDELIDGTEACYRILKRRFSGGGAQTAAQVLSMADGTPEEKAERVTALYDALADAGVRYGRSGEIAPLAALSLADSPALTLAEEIRDADEFLKGQKGYAPKETDEKQRAMQAVMIVSDRYAGTEKVNVTVMTNILDMLFSRQTASRISLAANILEALLQAVAAARKDGDGEKD